MPTPMTLTDLIDDAALFSLEHQLHLVDVLGEHDWHADLRAPRLEFIVLLARRPRASALGRKRHPPIADRS